MNHTEQLIAAAKAEDLQDLLNHIAWTDILLPAMQAHSKQYVEILVAEALGGPLPPGKTREQIAGICYGIQWAQKFFEARLRDGERAVQQLKLEGYA